MKKLLAILMALTMVLSMMSFAVAEETTDITLWTYPIGDWGKEESVQAIIDSFKAVHPEINVSVEFLSYTDGDATVTTAIEAGTAPDIVMEGPERLVSNWGVAGKMVDLSDLWTDEVKADMASAAIEAACKSADGAYYEYPLCMTTHCMAINYEMFEEAGALQYLDQETRTWTTENFEKAMQALVDAGKTPTGVVYCGGQGGDQGTRALAMNLYSAQWTDAAHTTYTMNSEAGVKGLNKLVEMDKAGLLTADPGIVAGDELQLFANGTVAMSLCWNASNRATYAEQVNFTPFAMAFPSDDGVPELCGGIWGFGVFNNGDDAKIAAAKTFIQYVSDDATQGPASVYATGFFPVRTSFGDIYTGTERAANADFNVFMQYLGDYYSVTPNWATQRTAWWNLLQQIFGGADVQSAADAYVEAAMAQ